MTKSGSAVNFTPWVAFRVLIEKSLCRSLNPSVLSHSRDEAGADAVTHLRNEERISTGWYGLQTAFNWFELLGIKRDAYGCPKRDQRISICFYPLASTCYPAKLHNLLNPPSNSSFTVPVGPLRCLVQITSITPRSVVDGL